MMILVCDDDPTVCTSLSLVLRRAGYEVASVSTPEEAVDFVRRHAPRLIVMDMNYSRTTTGEEGIELLRRVKTLRPEVPVILITAWGSIHLAVRGIRAGAFDFLTKPWNNLSLLKTIDTALQLTGVEGDPESGCRPPVELKREKIVGRSVLMERVLDTVARVARTSAPVLITGESGTGKALIAEAIHNNSDRSREPFVKVNLGGISQSLFESEMFGHKKGAFTDALYDRKGRFEMADGGSIFLDEIGELDPVSQVKLLRVLQDQTFEPLGSSEQKRVDTRIVSATNRNLSQMVKEGAFREDLFYRINLIQIRIPALRERTEDIPLLVNHFASLQAGLNGGESVRIDSEALEYLSRLPYPGNIRELKNLVDRTILLSGKTRLGPEDFREHYQPSDGGTLPADAVCSLELMEREMIVKAIGLYGGNVSRIAAALGLTRQALYRRLEKYELSLPEE